MEIVKPETLPRHVRVIVVSCGVILYLGLLFLLYNTLGNMMLALSFLPVALAGWLMGLRVSLVVSLLTFSTTT